MVQARFVGQRLDPVAINELINSPSGGLVRDMIRRSIRVQTMAKRLCKADTGLLRNSIMVELIYNGVHAGHEVPIARIGTNVAYAMMVHEGTGIYGPHGTPIIPTNKRYLAFMIKGARKRDSQGRFVKGQTKKNFVRVASVKGQKPNHFLRDALPAGRG
jgi:hypothetical protein